MHVRAQDRYVTAGRWRGLCGHGAANTVTSRPTWGSATQEMEAIVIDDDTDGAAMPEDDAEFAARRADPGRLRRQPLWLHRRYEVQGSRARPTSRLVRLASSAWPVDSLVIS